MSLRLSKAAISCLMIFFGLTLTAQESALRQANQRYNEEDYQGSVAIYDSLIHQGQISYALFYNLGCAYLHLKQADQAILNLEKARLISTHEDLRHNLQEAKSLIAEPIPEFSEFFLIAWWRGLLTSLGSNGYAILALGLVLMSLVCFFVQWRQVYDRLPRWMPFALLVLGFICLLLSWAALKEVQKDKHAIVMISSRDLYESPDERSERIRSVSPGIKVRIVDAIGEWRKVSLPDKDLGWLHEDWLEMIEI